jgi:hypothetical protein
MVRGLWFEVHGLRPACRPGRFEVQGLGMIYNNINFASVLFDNAPEDH